MKSMQNTQQNAIQSGYFTMVSAGVLLVHYYIVCHQLFPIAGLGPFERVLDTLREKFQQLPFTGDENISKVFALLLIIFPAFFSGEYTGRKAEFRRPAIGFGIGLLLFFRHDRVYSDEPGPGSGVGVSHHYFSWLSAGDLRYRRINKCFAVQAVFGPLPTRGRLRAGGGVYSNKVFFKPSGDLFG